MKFDVYAGLAGDERAEHICVTHSLMVARRAAAKARREYGGGWSIIFDRMSGERIICGRTA